MTSLALKLGEKLNKVAPVAGMSIGKPGDKSTWRIDFKPEATDAERQAAQLVLKNFDVVKAEARADVPQEVWAGAMMRALNTLGILEQIDQIVTAEGDLLAKKLWDRATAFRRDDPMISVIGGKAGWSENDLDDLFRLAESFNS